MSLESQHPQQQQREEDDENDDRLLVAMKGGVPVELRSVLERVAQASALFREGRLASARLEFSSALVSVLELSSGLKTQVKISMDPADGVQVFDFEKYGEEIEDRDELQVVHQAAVLVRNLGITLCKLENYIKAERFLTVSCKFKTTGLEIKSYFWRSFALLKLGQYEEALGALEKASKVVLLGKKGMLTERLHRRNEKMRRSRLFIEHTRKCKAMYDEAVGGFYDLEKLFLEEEPGRDHPPFNLKGVLQSYVKPETNTRVAESSDEVPGIVATRDYEEGQLIFVCKAAFLRKECDVDPYIVRYGVGERSTPMYSPIHEGALEQEEINRPQELLRRFCEYLITKNGRDPAQKNILEETCYHFAEGMGAVTENGEIDHLKVAEELQKQESLCEELLGEKLNPGPSEAFFALEDFCRKHSCQMEDLKYWDNDLLNEFVECSEANPGLDPFADDLISAAMQDAVLKERLLNLSDIHKGRPSPNQFSETLKVRRIAAIHRETSYDFKNGADFIYSKEQFPVETRRRRTALFDLTSWLGHSCVPNTKRVNFGHLCFLQASKDISKGDPLTCCYNNDVYYKRNALEELYGQKCHCELCRHGGVFNIDEDVCKWRDVFNEKVLPKVEPSTTVSTAKKHSEYALKLLEKLDGLLRNSIGKRNIEDYTRVMMYKCAFLDLYYELIARLERRSELELKLIAYDMRQRRIDSDSHCIAGLYTLVGKQCMVLKDGMEKAKSWLPQETNVIRSFLFLHDKNSLQLMSNAVKAILFKINFPSSDLLPVAHAEKPASNKADFN